jgi:hypothetical protein
VLKHHIYGPRAQLFGVGEDVHVGQRGGRRLFQEHGAARLKQLDSDLRVIPGRRRDGHEVRLVCQEIAAGSVCHGPVVCGKRSGTYWVDIDCADQLDVCVVLVAEGMRTSDRATSDDPDAERFFVSRPVHWANPIIVALCCARIASRITSKVCLWGQAVSVRLITSCTRSG